MHKRVTTFGAMLERDEHETPRGKLFHPVWGNIRAAHGGYNSIVRSVPWLAVKAIPCDYFNSFITSSTQKPYGLCHQVLLDVDGGHMTVLAHDLLHQGGVVTGACTDL